VVPLPSIVEGLVRDLPGRLEYLATEDGEQGRALLRRYMPPIVLTPDAKGA
jgi:hypothetical protein